MDECIEAMTEVLSSPRARRAHQPLRSIVFPPSAGERDRAHAGVPRRRETRVFAEGDRRRARQPEPRPRFASGRRAAARRQHGRAARGPQRVADHGHPDGCGIRRRDARARAPRRAGRGDHRDGRSGQVTRGGDEGRAGRAGDPDVEQSRGRHRPGARRRRRHGLHVHDRRASRSSSEPGSRPAPM